MVIDRLEGLFIGAGLAVMFVNALYALGPPKPRRRKPRK